MSDASTPHHVAIVGCGFAGTSALWQLVQRFPVKHITVFEASGEFGPGYPYRGDDSGDYLINNTTDTMCLVPSHRGAFLDWLKLSQHPGAASPSGHLPRREFGAFLKEVVRASLVDAAIKHIRVDLIPHEALGLSELPDGAAEIRWQGGRVTADAVILTTGRCPDAELIPPAPADATARYWPTHIRQADLDSMPLDADVHVMGASLSAYDIVNRLYAPATGCEFVRDAAGTLTFVGGDNRRRLVLASRSGRLKKVQGPKSSVIRRTRLTASELARRAQASGGLTLEDIQDLVNEEALNHGVAVDWPSVFDPYQGCEDAADVDARAGAILAQDLEAARAGGTRNFLVDLVGDAQMLLWDLFANRWLRPDQERRYRRQLERALLCYAAPCPIPTAERLLALHQAGRVVFRQGADDLRLDDSGEHWAYAHRFGTERARFVINATGSVDRRLQSPRQGPLMTSLRDAGLLKPFVLDGEASDGVAVDMKTFRSLHAPNVYVANMSLWGPGFFTSSAFLMANVVERAVAAMFEARGGAA